MDGIFISLVIVAASIGVIIVRNVHLWLRNNLPKSVQCWFCHNKTQVEYKLANSWYCSRCEQYNGFKKDGDYNRLVSNQYEEKLNFTVTSIGRSKDNWKSGNRLCNICNRNQELKVQQLASFVPLNENNYDVEIEHFRAQLEKCYKLCSNCKGLLSNIFSNERTLFSIPRRLVSGLVIKPEVTGVGRPILYLNFLVSLIISLSRYFKFEELITIVNLYLENYKIILPYWIVKDKCLLPILLILNVLGWINTTSSGLLLNSLSWLIVLVLSLYANEFKHYIIALQVISGIVSCGVSIICLTSNQRKVKALSPEKKKFNNSQFNHVSTNIGTSETQFESAVPLNEHVVSRVYQKGNRVYSNNIKPPSPIKTEASAVPAAATPKSTNPSSQQHATQANTNNVIKPQKSWTETINGIRGLNLGNNSNQVYGNNLTRRGGGGDRDAWWLGGSNVKSQKKSPKNMSTTAINYQNGGINNNRPPSTPSSGFSDMLMDDMMMDDYGSCTGHSPICRHYPCHIAAAPPPPPPQYQCYYAAAQFQRLLYSTQPSTPSSQNTTPDRVTNNQSNISTKTFDAFSYFYSMPIIVLILSNVALLWTVYYRETVKD